MTGCDATTGGTLRLTDPATDFKVHQRSPRLPGCDIRSPSLVLCPGALTYVVCPMPVLIRFELRRAVLRWPASVLFACSLVACGGRAAVATAPAPEPAPTAAPVQVRAPIVIAPAAPDSARSDWHRLDYETDGVLGVGSDRALRELLASRMPMRRVVVAVIDGGIDTAHTMLAPNLWRNPREVAGNSRDDDGNGFVDDVRGWNLVVGADGRSFDYDTFELTRQYAACRGLAAGIGTPRPSETECGGIALEYAGKVREVSTVRLRIRAIDSVLTAASGVLRSALDTARDTTPLSRASVTALVPSSARVAQAKQIWLQLDENGINAESIGEGVKAYDSQYRYGLDSTYNPAIGSNGVAAVRSTAAGNNDVTGPDASHGTHVAGIIGATRVAAQQVQGIAPMVSLLSVRTVPNGDERDLDVARAIRYATDNGAQIINMSFGKGSSPYKASVDSAVRYAMSKGVLLVHAAGNDGENIDSMPSFPSPVLDDGTIATNWIEVGASSWRGPDQLAAGFSNYGRTRVDLFAPGEDILSTLPNGRTGRESGTSMAAPVVSGVAALLMAYFPELSAADVKSLLMASVRSFADQPVAVPGSDTQAPFGTLSRTGGVIDAFAAVKRALERASVKP